MNDAARVWDAEADRFDDQPDHGLTDPGVRAAWADLLLPLLPCCGARVADLGCGTGSLSLLLAEAGHVVRGRDISPEMVARARAKLSAAGIAAEFDVGDAGSPPWPRGTFDVVLARHVLWALEDPEAVLGRWVRLLAPGGLLILVEGRWSTGAGLSAADLTALVLRHRVEADVIALDDPGLWGGPIDDERFAVVSRH